MFTQLYTNASGVQQPPTGSVFDTSYTYDDEGVQTSVTYPMGQTHLTALDFLKRPLMLTYQKPGQTVPGPIIDGVSYNAADQVTGLSWPDNNGSLRDKDAYSYPAFTETMAYNAFNQLVQIQTRVNGAPTVDLNYQYPAGQNNGQISGVATGLPADQAGLNATYSYDGLKRLQSVTRAAGTQQYAYDGWGNLSGKTGLGANFTLYADPMTNRLAGGGLCYDANGNLISTGQQCAAEYGYDLRNRLARVAVTTSGQPDLSAELYYYTEDNKRVTTVRPNGTTNQVFYVYGAKNEIAAICTAQILGQAPACDPREPRDVRFAGRMIRQNFYPVVEDRVGSVIANPWTSSGSTPPKQYLPYGEQLNYPQSGTAFPGNTNFATYFHDATTGLDYADQRFYTSTYGRFMTADPYRASAGPEDPGSWNRYAYVGSDPVNRADPEGLLARDADGYCPASYVSCDETWPNASVWSGRPNGRDTTGNRLDDLVSAGPLADWQWAHIGASPVILTFQSQTAPIAAAICVAQPELCVLAAGTGLAIYVAVRHLPELLDAIQKQSTARAHAPVRYVEYTAGRDDNGDCLPPDPDKYVKWRGSGDDHWHWITWNQHPVDCETFPYYKSGPNDPGSRYREIPR